MTKIAEMKGTAMDDQTTAKPTAMQNAISTAIAEAQRYRGNCDPDGDPCGTDCACWLLVHDDLERRRGSWG